jgi:hypothetical protein
MQPQADVPSAWPGTRPSKLMHGRELSSQVARQKKARVTTEMKAKCLAAGGKNWQPFCQEKCATKNVKISRGCRLAAGASGPWCRAGQVGGAVCHCVMGRWPLS